MSAGTKKQSHTHSGLPPSSALYVGSLEKGFRVLAAFSDDFPSLGVTEIALRTGLDKSAAQRFSNTLHQLGFLEKDPVTRRYRPARKLMELGYTYLRHSALGAVAMPRLIEAGSVYSTTMNLAERDDTDMIYTVRIPHQKAAYAATVPGRRVPAFCTATGQAVLSRLNDDEVAQIIERSNLVKRMPDTIIDIDKIHAAITRTRKQGFAITYEQLLPREIGAAAPIVDYRGRPHCRRAYSAYTPGWSVAKARDKLGPLAIETRRRHFRRLVASEQEY